MENKHVFYNPFQVTKKDRQKLHGHKSYILWFTGLSGAGKSTIANCVEKNLHQMGFSTYVLDGDNLRLGLNQDLKFSPQDRAENIRRVGEVAKLLVESGIIVLATFIAPYARDREMVKNMMEEDEFIEIYVQCPLEVCEQRDTKGLYKKARKGEIKDFTGISAPYEIPLFPGLIVETENNTIEESCLQVINFIIENKVGHFEDWGDK